MFLQFLNSFRKAIRFACIRVASSSAQMTGATRDSLFFNFLSKTIRLSLSCCFLKMPKLLKPRRVCMMQKFCCMTSLETCPVFLNSAQPWHILWPLKPCSKGRQVSKASAKDKTST